jgi:hypothetical protein
MAHSLDIDSLNRITMKNTLLLICVTCFMFGCGTPGHVHEGDPTKISVGMTREQVVLNIGRPETVSSDGNTEILGYTLERPWWQTGKFRVKLVDGKVQSYEVLDH